MPEPTDAARARVGRRCVARILVLLWGAVPLYFVAAASLGGATDARDALVRLAVVGGAGAVLLVGLLVIVWRWERAAVRVLYVLSGLALAYSAATLLWSVLAISERRAPAVVLVNVAITGAGVVAPLLAGLLLSGAAQRADAERRAEERTGVVALWAGFVVLLWTAVGLLALVIGNVLAIRENWLLAVNYGFLAFVGAVAGWQLWVARPGQPGQPGRSGASAGG
ncbi:MAG TPA: hypothetical protein VFX49_13555 [Chloroflexota bacterium]|nr:hypothetical protein [Chloroflexota bacterium]